MAIILAIFSYGFTSNHFKIFPHNEILSIYKYYKKKIDPDLYLYSKYLTDTEFQKFDQNEKIIRSKYKENASYWDRNFKINKYKPNLQLWSNRQYINLKNNKKIENLFIIQIPRHYKKPIMISIDGSVTVYRALCEKNYNDNYIDYKKLDFKLMIIGNTCIHSKVISKTISENFYEIIPGGPISSDPIFIGNFDNKINFKILK